ncbi:MAG: hypothetical protein WCI57_00055 [Candidatus Berkelbacteria bacterium]
MKRSKVRLIVIIICVLLIVWFLRPFFHPFVMSFVVSPLKGILILAIIAGIVMFMKKFGKLSVVPAGPQNYTIHPSNQVGPKIVFGYIGLLILLFVALNFESEIRYLITAKQIDYTDKADLPTFDPIRLTPKQVAKRYADDTFQNPQEKLGDSQIVLMDGKLERVFPRNPDGGLLYLLNKMNGFVTVEVDTLDRKVSIEDQQFKYADGIGIFDNLYYRLALKKYAVTYSSEPIYLKDGTGKWVTVVPYVGYKGLIFRVPYWAGVMVVQSDGTITDYTPEQAQELAYMKGNRIYPKELVYYYTDSYSYKGGLLNKWFLHKNQIETVSLSGSEEILHASTTEGLKQMVVAEPYGSSYGIYKIFLFDATTGKREVIQYDQNSQLTGPIAAADYIKREFPTYSWDAFSLAEPRPIKVNGDLNWLLSIIPNDAAGIAKTVLFDAKTNKVVGVDTEAQFNAYVTQGIVTTGSTVAPTTATTTGDTAAIKAKIDEIQKQVDELKALVK